MEIDDGRENLKEVGRRIEIPYGTGRQRRREQGKVKNRWEEEGPG
jgi:hypothetical protein